MPKRLPTNDELLSMVLLRKDQRFLNEKLHVVDFHFDSYTDTDSIKGFAKAFLTASLDARLSAPIYDSKELSQMMNLGTLLILVQSTPPEYKPFTVYVSETSVDYGLLVSVCHKLAEIQCIRDVSIDGVSINDVDC